MNTTGIFTPEALLEHWLGHRRVTRRMIEAFPEDKLFTYSIGGMRPFSELVMEFIGMAEPGIDGVATGKWDMVNELPHHGKKQHRIRGLARHKNENYHPVASIKSTA